MAKTMEIKMVKKQALLIALASALALGAVTTSFAQEAVRSNNGSYYNGSSQYGSSQYVPGYGNTGAGSGPSGEW
jgi:uncharacterized membrane protein